MPEFTLNNPSSSVMNLASAVILLDAKQNILWWNQQAEDLFELNTTHLQQNITKVIASVSFTDYLKNFQQQPDGILIADELRRSALIRLRINAFVDNQQLLLAYDVAGIRQLEQIRKDFVDNVSHELRTPLTVLSGYLETLSDSDDMSPRWKRAFDQMQQQTRRMNALVNDLLFLSRLENEAPQAPRKFVDMAELMHQVFDDAQGYNAEYGHSLHLRVGSHDDLLGSEVDLASAFNNLITNAIKYTPRHGDIYISWQNQGDEVVFSVQDSGIGISPQHLPRLTERFYRVDTGRSRATGGTGLGLAIVKHVLAQHNARLEIESVENVGSTFKVIFPAERIHRAEQNAGFIDFE
ncbi:MULTISPECIES: phosphate regulon sensor histidine kinase PhoR [unclassified Acinetobacter]|uniref:phosphate regulon sensor histidine kinase PhoR n=1 Tax=unclassified Acinetobacter TaxID=196816 RepID=UPI0035B915FF